MPQPNQYTSARWTDETRAALMEYYKGHYRREIVQYIKEKTGVEYTERQIKSYMHNHHLNSGLTGRFERGHVPHSKGKKIEEFMSAEAIERCSKTRFKKGQSPINELPVGAEVINADGYHMTKVQMKGAQWERWNLTHRLIWEQHNGPIPEEMYVMFLDGNKDNLDISNLALVTRREHANMNKKGRRSTNPEVTQAYLNIVKIENAITDRRKNNVTDTLEKDD